LFHQVRVTLAVLLLLEVELALVLEVLVLPLLLHAAIVTAAATATAAMAGFLEPRMRSHLLTMPRNSYCRVCYWRGLLALPKAADAHDQ
jgi:hypothetical protein